MKKLMVLLMAMTMVGMAQAQDTWMYPRKNVLKINPIGFANSEFQMQYERYLNNRTSSISVIPSVILEETGRESKEGWQAMVQYRSYLSHRSAHTGRNLFGFHNYGFYAGAYALYMDYTEDYRRGYDDDTGEVDQNGYPIFKYVQGDFRKTVSAIEGGALIGVQMDVTERIVIDFNIGGGVRRVELEDTFDELMNEHNYYEDYGVFDVEYQGVKPRVALLLGFTF